MNEQLAELIKIKKQIKNEQEKSLKDKIKSVDEI